MAPEAEGIDFLAFLKKKYPDSYFKIMQKIENYRVSDMSGLGEVSTGIDWGKLFKDAGSSITGLASQYKDYKNTKAETKIAQQNLALQQAQANASLTSSLTSANTIKSLAFPAMALIAFFIFMQSQKKKK